MLLATACSSATRRTAQSTKSVSLFASWPNASTQYTTSTTVTHFYSLQSVVFSLVFSALVCHASTEASLTAKFPRHILWKSISCAPPNHAEVVQKIEVCTPVLFHFPSDKCKSQLSSKISQKSCAKSWFSLLCTVRWRVSRFVQQKRRASTAGPGFFCNLPSF